MLLTNPIWLFALTAISIPVIIHLWNIKPGKTLKVGSISLFTASSQASNRIFKLLDILLLLVRCLLLLLLAFLLAAPLLSTRFKTNNAKGWVLLPSANFKETYNHFQAKIDSLTNTGYELHFLETGFSKQELSKAKTHSVKYNDTLNYWSLLKQLADQVSPVTPIELFTPNLIKHFKGEKPNTPLQLKWHTYIPADSVASWPVSAWLMADGKIRVLQGSSTPTGTLYQYKDIVNGQNSVYKSSVNNGILFIRFENATIPVDTTTCRIAIYADNPIPDANYLKAALLAVSQVTGRNTVIKFYKDAATIPDHQNWIYWLSEKPLLGYIRSKTKNLFIYEPGKSAKIQSWLSNTNAQTLTQGRAKTALYQIVTSKKVVGNSVWVDGFDNPILTSEQKSQLNTYHFYSRFNPAWTDLVWQNEFPKWVLELTQPIADDITQHDRRLISDTQLKPAFTAGKIYDEPNSYKDLSFYLWLALVFSFATERWLSTKNKKELVNG
ncbi:BatA domain-containing protein [Mucilaginibacter sp. HD30]